VSQKNYAAAFGAQWNYFQKTQLDSFTHTSISQDRLERMLGPFKGALAGKLVLEAGCGAGRFTEILLKMGARVVATDLSSAVDANYDNCHTSSEYLTCQADIVSLPFSPSTFDVVICVGVIQHTPNPDRTIAALCNLLKSGGVLIIDHYSKEYPATFIQKMLRSIMVHLPTKVTIQGTVTMVKILWPLHLLLWKFRHTRILWRLYQLLTHLSPVIDFQTAYPQLSKTLLRDWAILDTHDTLTDKYKHLKSLEEIQDTLQRNGMKNIEATYAGNGVEARATRA